MPTSSFLPAPTSAAASPIVTLAELDDVAAHYAERGLEGSKNTQRAYKADLRSFHAFCADRQLSPLPAVEKTVTGYIAQLAEEGKKYATIQRHIAAVAKMHHLAGVQTPTTGKMIQTVLSGIARTKGRRQKQAPAFTTEQLRNAIEAMDLSTPTGLRDRALLLVGFAGAFRRSELVALNIESVQTKPDGLLVSLAGSKTNQFGADEYKMLFYGSLAMFCPIRALQEWIKSLGRTSGPLFVSVRWAKKNQPATPTQQRLSDWSVNELVKKHLGPAFSAHSLRASFVTISVMRGANNKAIRNQTGQKTDAMIERYTRLNDVSRHNSAQNLGL